MATQVSEYVYKLSISIYCACNRTKDFEISLIQREKIIVVILVKFRMYVKMYMEVTRYLLQIYASVNCSLH